MKLFDLDGPLFQAMNTLTNLVVLNILFCICCIPVITIGAASTALHGCVQELLDEKKEKGLIQRYFGKFRKEFGHSTLIWLFCLIVFGILFLYQKVVSVIDGALGQSYQILFYIICIIFLFGFQYLFPMQARYGKQVGFTMKYAWLISAAALPWSLAAVISTGVLIYVSFFMNPDIFSTTVYLWLVVGFGVLAYITNIFYLKAFDKFAPILDGREE